MQLSSSVNFNNTVVYTLTDTDTDVYPFVYANANLNKIENNYKITIEETKQIFAEAGLWEIDIEDETTDEPIFSTDISFEVEKDAC